MSIDMVRDGVKNKMSKITEISVKFIVFGVTVINSDKLKFFSFTIYIIEDLGKYINRKSRFVR